jgi:hypothetical protein
MVCRAFGVCVVRACVCVYRVSVRVLPCVTVFPFWLGVGVSKVSGIWRCAWETRPILKNFKFLGKVALCFLYKFIGGLGYFEGNVSMVCRVCLLRFSFFSFSFPCNFTPYILFKWTLRVC